MVKFFDIVTVIIQRGECMQNRQPDSKECFKSKLNIEEIIKEANKKFIPGYEVGRQFFSKYHEQGEKNYYNPNEDKFSDCLKPGYKYVHTAFTSFPNLQDEKFSNGNDIQGTNFIAAEGPGTNAELDKFLSETVFHSSTPIHTVVAIGDEIYNQPRMDGDFEVRIGDFINYSLIEERETQHYIIKQKWTDASIRQNYREDFIKFRSMYEVPIAYSKLTIKEKETKLEKEMDVYTIDLRDNQSITFEMDESERFRKLMWIILYTSISKKALVHCAAGIGRTGHFIATLLFLRNFEAIFEAENVTAAADKIIEILNLMRKDRLCLINTQAQFENAIRNAHSLYLFGANKSKPYTIKLKELIELSINQEKTTEKQVKVDKPELPLIKEEKLTVSTAGFFKPLIQEKQKGCLTRVAEWINSSIYPLF